MLSNRQDLRLLAQIEAIHSINIEIIEQLRATSEVTKFTYHLSRDGEGLFTCTEHKTAANGDSVLGSWKPNLQLKPVVDFFNDSLNFDVKSFKALVQLNDDMLRVCRKFKLFGGSQDAIEELTKYKDNFEMIQVALGRLDGHASDENGSLPEIMEKLEKVNEAIRDLTDFVSSVSFQDPSTWMKTTCTSHTVSADYRTAELLSGQYGCLLSSYGFNVGVHVWKVKLLSRTSTCMFGVAPDTVSKSGAVNNYNTNGFYVDFNTGTKYSGPPYSYSNSAYASSFPSGSVVEVILDCDAHTLSYKLDGRDLGVAYTNLPSDKKLYLAWDNNTTAGSKIQFM